MVSFLSFSDSDDSGDDLSLEAQPCLMEKGESGESSLFELSREHQFRVKVCSYGFGDVLVLFHFFLYKKIYSSFWELFLRSRLRYVDF